jgi:RHS repeat-associated protein
VRLTNGADPEYTHADHLGSPIAATDAAGAIKWRESYNPFGEARLKPAANANNTGYTGHVQDDDSGLTYMQARYYDPVIGRFLSPDPIGYKDGFNVYAYVRNDPVNGFDPTGAFLVDSGWNGTCDWDGTCAGAPFDRDTMLNIGPSQPLLKQARKNPVRSRSGMKTGAPDGRCGGCEYELPEDVRVALEQFFGDYVAGIVIYEHSLFAGLHIGMRATTRKNTIYLRGSGDAFVSEPRFILEEYYHVIEQWGTGDMTVLSYLWESLLKGYERNRYELEAKKFARDNASRYVNLRQGPP